MLTTMGRAGTTWTMRLLSEHPEIVVHRWHPYELRTARYWWHMFKTLSEPRDPHHSAQADHFQTNKQWIGYNPFYPEPIAVTPGLGEWMGRDYVEDLARFCQRSAEETYLRIAAGQGQTGVKYMAEKHRADNLPWLVWELYPKAKEIFLVRDFRDVYSSMLAFNQKFGRRAFGPSHIETDEEFANFLRNSTIRNLSRSWPKRQDRAHLIRYEDLITKPAGNAARHHPVPRARRLRRRHRGHDGARLRRKSRDEAPPDQHRRRHIARALEVVPHPRVADRRQQRLWRCPPAVRLSGLNSCASSSPVLPRPATCG